ncbi:Signal transduction histidine kinase [Candidatus Rhodobacter oscarellae]|uniref:histidine kinase n=1 Tax=Candidatus Rhodobacter oscarellae TaxID=1675527 RepID=A0A0J9E1D2_9RHOB|nr:cache domain-containing protein [Candidatus Rhodobacter lobularis]KMW56545.1 Signal transduction histidine kinase [Candidatus Rhodobacter lobularis]
MRSVRLRLLILALLPLIVLMPLLLLLGGSRWTADYDKVLIANVESDLRIAEQYLLRIMEGTGTDLGSMASSTDFADALDGGETARAEYLDAQRKALQLDFLYYLPRPAATGSAHWPVIARALGGDGSTEIDIFSAQDMAALPGDLSARARFDLIDTPNAVPTNRIVEDRGMVVHSASPIDIEGHDGVVVGGILLNRNLQFIDTINALVYLNAVTGGERQGTATLFLEDVRVSTNVRLFEGGRALGTRVSAVVRQAVLDEGQTWLARAFVVNDWYISGYLPLVDSHGARVGMLYVGFLEAPFTAAKRAAVTWMLAAFLAVLAISAPLFLWLAKGIFSPLERMTHTMNKVEAGDLSARNGKVGSRDEIGQVAAHLDELLDQVQDRDRELNARVEERTAELRAANAKLETTFKQLVMSEKLASIGEITAGVAHEINNPVAVIQGNVDVIREELGPAAEPVKTELGLIDRQVMRIGAIVGKLLQFARPGEYSGFDETVSMSAVLADCLVLVDHVLSRKEIEVRSALPEVPVVRIDPGEMQQVVINLLVNATQAMGDAGVLSLRVGPEMRDGLPGVALSVQDTGPGIPEGKLATVFDPFYTTKLGEGTGLGLSISQTLIQNAGGLISVTNGQDGGAIFVVWLPEAKAEETAAA